MLQQGVVFSATLHKVKENKKYIKKNKKKKNKDHVLGTYLKSDPEP